MNSATSSRSYFWFAVLMGAVVCVFTLITFSSVLSADFVPFDDDIQILTNPHVQEPINFTNLAWMFSDTHQAERYTPLSWLAWSLIHQGFGLTPAAFHAEALLLHVLNSVLLFAFLLTLCRRLARENGGNTPIVIATIGAMLWSVHPLRVEVVAWVTQVRFAEATALALISIILYMRAAGTVQGSLLYRPPFWGAVAAYTASVLFYPIGIGLIVILLALDVLPLRRFSTALPAGRQFLRLFLEKIPFVIPAAFVGAMTLYGRFAQSYLFAAPVSLQEFGMAHRAMQAAYLFLYYVWKPFDPAHVSPVYTTLVHFQPWSLPFMASFVAFLVITCAALACWRRFPALTLIWIAHLALIAPVGGYFEHPYYPSDRYGYLDGILGSVVVAAALVHLWPRMRSSVQQMVAIGIGILVLTLAVLSNAQSRVWHNGESLFQQLLLDLGTDPYAVDIHFRLGNYYLAHAQLADAREQIDASLKRDPNYPRALHAKGMLLLTIAQNARAARQSSGEFMPLYLQAAQSFDREVRLNGSLEGMAYAGYAYGCARQFDIAQAALRLALEKDPGNAKYHLLLGNVDAMAGRMQDATAELDRAVQLSPMLSSRRDGILSQWSQLAHPESGTLLNHHP